MVSLIKTYILQNKSILKLFVQLRGIPLISKDRDIRIQAIGDELANGNYDVVSLQEVWCKNDFEKLHERTKDVLKYSHYFYR